ncbi:STING-like protein [Mya arenaria]|uniref:STING-like protein n=1 Tax=Mya arenaria TaxID=6604 RepID=A0ABY7ETH6_MYAAR|nr:STING-like protein [Mya arenaria]
MSEVASSEQSRDVQYEFDVFLCHSGIDENITRQIHKSLTSQGLKCAAQFDSTTFPTGRPVLASIGWLVQNSRKTIVVLTRNALESSWISVETILALENSQERREQDLTLRLLLIDIDKRDVPMLKCGLLASIPHTATSLKRHNWDRDVINSLRTRISVSKFLPVGSLAHAMVFSHFTGLMFYMIKHCATTHFQILFDAVREQVMDHKDSDLKENKQMQETSLKATSSRGGVVQMEERMPCGDVATGLCWAYIINYLRHTLYNKDFKGRIQRFLEEKNMNCGFLTKMYIWWPRSCKAADSVVDGANIGAGEGSQAPVKKIDSLPEVIVDQGAQQKKPFILNVFQYTRPADGKIFCFVSEYCAAMGCLYQMAKNFAFAGISTEEMYRQGKVFVDKFVEISSRQAVKDQFGDFNECAKVVYYDDSKTNLLAAIENEIRQAEVDESAICYN